MAERNTEISKKLEIVQEKIAKASSSRTEVSKLYF